LVKKVLEVPPMPPMNSVTPALMRALQPVWRFGAQRLEGWPVVSMAVHLSPVGS
jgi:hypothetical protein